MLSIFRRKDTNQLWQAILDREPELRRLSPTQAREELKKDGYPRSLIQDYLVMRERERPRGVVQDPWLSSSSSSSSSSGS